MPTGSTFAYLRFPEYISVLFGPCLPQGKVRERVLLIFIRNDSRPHLQPIEIKVLTVAPLIGEAITRIHQGDSVGALFSSEIQRTQEMLLWGDEDEDNA